MAAPAGTEILDVLMPMFSGSIDSYGKEVVPARPLGFDMVNGGRPPQCTARLFQLPLEILGIILEHVASDSLAALALVNHDCLQLARSRQFVSIKLDYSDASLAILDKLLAEMTERLGNPGDKSSPSLGACIRRITVATHPGWVTYRHGVSLGDENFRALPENERSRLMTEASSAFFGAYIPRMQCVLNHFAMPHLELLDWEDKIGLPQTFYNHLALSPVKHLKLFRVMVDQEFRIELPEAFRSYKWPLQTLYLELCSNLRKIGEVSTAPLAASILRLCASTLESLTLKSSRKQDPYTFLDQDPAVIPCFTSLRHLTLETVIFEDASMLKALVNDNLRTLDVDIEQGAVSTLFFQKRGTIRNLENFIWESYNIRADHPLDFLRANPQLLKLAIPHQSPSTLLESELLPLLSQSFSELKSLSLVWDGVNISESALELISSLKSLEQLHLSSGNQYGWRHDWHINHDVMRKYVSKLTLLKRVAFSRDTYFIGHTNVPSEKYYELRLLSGNELPDNSDDNDIVWEEKHRSRMVTQANAYISAIPTLEWLYFGQIPMRVDRMQETSYGVAIPLSQDRDDCWTLLRKMFGGKTD